MDKPHKKIKNRNTPCRRRRNAIRALLYRLKIGSVKDIGVQTDPIIDEIQEEKVELGVRVIERVSPIEDVNKVLNPVNFEEGKSENKESVQVKSGILGFLKKKFKNNAKAKSVKCKSNCDKNSVERNKECGSQLDCYKKQGRRTSGCCVSP